MGFLEMFFIAINVSLYLASGYIFIQYLLFVKANYLMKFTGGKLSLNEIASITFGLVIMLVLVIYGPPTLAKAIGQGWNNFMGEMQDVTNGIVNDVYDLVGGKSPVYIQTETTNSTTSPRVYTDEQRQPAGEPFTIPGVVVGGDPYNDEHAGGGIGSYETLPTAIFQNPTPVPVIPTPTLAPTATPFSAETWNPSMPPPTPQVYPRNP